MTVVYFREGAEYSLGITGMNGAFRKTRGRLKGVALGSLFLCLCTPLFPAARGAEFFVAPNGSPGADGSVEAPWDLQTAFNHPPGVAPGDLIWLRGGVYRNNNQLTRFTSFLAGVPNNPILVRQYPGERAIIDGNVVQYAGGWVHYWGFEIMNTHSNRVTTESGSFPTTFFLKTGGQTNDWTVSGFDLRAPHVKLINLSVHDSIGGGISISTSAIEPEVYGNLVYYNGWQGCDRSHGHGIYIQSLDPSSARVADNLFFANYALGIQATGNGEVVDNISFEGNVAFSNSILARRHQGNFLLGAVVGLAKNPVLISNYIYAASGSLSDSNIGYIGGSTNAVVSGNYFQTSVHFSEQTEGLTLTNNTFLSSTAFLERSQYPNNSFFDEVPSVNVVEVRTNKYEPGRATIIIYNWENRSTVPVDVAGVLDVGTPYEVRSAQNYHGATIVSGIFDGAPLELPMAILPVSKPVGGGAPASTAPAFQVFILQLATPSPDPNFSNTAPTISSIPARTTHENQETEPVAFIIQDAEIPSDFLDISVLSSNPKLVPNKNIRIEGTGDQRQLTIKPAQNQTGSAEITLGISDGFKHAETAFTVEVLPPPESPPIEEDHNGGHLSISLIGDHITIRVSGIPDFDYAVLASTDLSDWHFAGTISTDCQGIGRFDEDWVHNGPPRYYRFFKGNE